MTMASTPSALLACTTPADGLARYCSTVGPAMRARLDTPPIQPPMHGTRSTSWPRTCRKRRSLEVIRIYYHAPRLFASRQATARKGRVVDSTRAADENG